MDEEPIGTIEHYYPKAHAAVLHVEQGEVCLGDVLHICGPGREVTERVTSLELEHRPIPAAHAGERVGVLVSAPVHEKDQVFLVHEEPPEDARWRQ